MVWEGLRALQVKAAGGAGAGGRLKAQVVLGSQRGGELLWQGAGVSAGRVVPWRGGGAAGFLPQAVLRECSLTVALVGREWSLQ